MNQAYRFSKATPSPKKCAWGVPARQRTPVFQIDGHAEVRGVPAARRELPLSFCRQAIARSVQVIRRQPHARSDLIRVCPLIVRNARAPAQPIAVASCIIPTHGELGSFRVGPERIRPERKSLPYCFTPFQLKAAILQVLLKPSHRHLFAGDGKNSRNMHRVESLVYALPRLMRSRTHQKGCRSANHNDRLTCRVNAPSARG